MAVGVQKAWSVVADSNGNSDANANWAEGFLMPAINNSARANMAAIKGWANQIQGGCTFGGAGNAYTITSDAAAAISAAYGAGMMFMLKANHTNSGAATLNVDGVGAVAIKTSDGGDLAAGDIVQNGLYLFAYNSTGPRFDLIGTFAGGAFQPLGATLTALEALDLTTPGSVPVSTGPDTLVVAPSSTIGRALWNYTDPNADRILFFDDSAGAFADLSLGTGLSITTTTLNLSANLQTYSGITPSANVQSFLGAADYAAMRTQLSLGTAALATIGTSGDTVPKNNTANTWSISQIMTASLDMRNDIRMTDAGTNRWALGRAAGGGGAADDFQLYNYGTTTVAFRIPLLTNVVNFLQTPTAGGVAIPTISSSDTLSNKTIASPTLSGTVAGSVTFSGTINLSQAGDNVMRIATTGGVQSAALELSADTSAKLWSIVAVGSGLGSDSLIFCDGGWAAGSTRFTIEATGDLVGTSVGPTSVYSLGYRGTPQNIQNGSYTFVLADAGKQVHAFSATCNYTIPPNSSVAFPIGTVIPILSTGATISVLEGSGVFLNRGDGTSGSGTRTVGPNSMAAITKNDTNTWIISGAFT